MLRLRYRIVTLCFGLTSLTGLACGVVTRGPHAVTSGARWTCAAPGSDIAERVRAFVRDYAAPQSELADRYRVHINLPRVPTESVAIITTPEVCGQAGLAYARTEVQHLSPGVYEMAVVRAGNRYVVRGVTAPSPAGEWNMITVFDLSFRPLIGILAF